MCLRDALRSPLWHLERFRRLCVLSCLESSRSMPCLKAPKLWPSSRLVESASLADTSYSMLVVVDPTDPTINRMYCKQPAHHLPNCSFGDSIMKCIKCWWVELRRCQIYRQTEVCNHSWFWLNALETKDFSTHSLEIHLKFCGWG